jgi:hypothetical protein
MVKGNAGNELVKIKQDELMDLTSFEDAVKFLAEKGFTVATAEDLLSDGFNGVEKAKLVNRTFIIIDAKVSESDDYTNADGESSSFAVVKVMTQDGKKFRFTDGGTGVCLQIQTLLAKREGGAVGVIVPGGLVDSEYPYVDSDGNKSMAHTFYLNTETE